MNSNERLAKAIETGVPVPGTPEQARELVAHENEAAAQAARTDAWLAKAREATVVTNRCERSDERRYGKPGPGRPGSPVFDRVTMPMNQFARARLWARMELNNVHGIEDAPDHKAAQVIRWIADALETGELPHHVETTSRRGCCGATLIQHETEDGTDYECPLCGKDVMP